MADYIKNPPRKSLQEAPFFTFYSNGTQDITSVEQLAIYGSFEYKCEIHEHFIGLLPLSQLVGTSLSVENIMDVLENLFRDIKVSIMNARFACMDTTNVNSAEKGGLKAFLEFLVPHLYWTCS